MPATYGVIDLFAGPGGLGEGFAALEEGGHHPFRIGISVEKEASAQRTLRLRAFLRDYRKRHGRLPEEYIAFHAGERDEPDWEQVDAKAWQHACSEARQLELGSEEAAREIDLAIERISSEHQETILIGGPPCQAYSLVGRARSRGKEDYVPEKDERHFLFREYIRVLDRLRPAIFVMENVKGMLSSTVQRRRVFEMLMEDLSSLGHAGEELYQLRAFRLDEDAIRLREVDDPSEFIVRAEQFGIPQKRHRVIIIGVRSDLADQADGISIPLRSPIKVSIAEAIGDLASLRSGLNPQKLDSADGWKKAVGKALRKLKSLATAAGEKDLASAFVASADALNSDAPKDRSSRTLPQDYGSSNLPLRRWLENKQLRALAQHETRGHMDSDLARYLFVSTFGKIKGRSPKSSEFPEELAPDHKSWSTGKFADRFRVQIADQPATTITCHISKDGHYFIHPDPTQCRSLTVREAARLQTFPDDYYFLGPPTDQRVQVGNAVPPYLARQIAQLLLRLLEASHSGSSASLSSEAELVTS